MTVPFVCSCVFVFVQKENVQSFDNNLSRCHPFFFVRWLSLCVWLYVLCAFGSLCAIHNVPYPSAAACQDVPSFRCQIFCQVTYCVFDCIFIGCIWVLVLVKMSHPLAAACQDVPSFARWPIVCVMYVLCVIGSLC